MILAFETATPHGSVALLAGKTLLAESVLPAGRQVSETYLPVVAGLFRKTGTGPGDVSHVAVSAGPGSFTGLRVGMAAAKGFCFGRGIPIATVPTLHALALRFPSAGMTICTVLDAKKKQVYAAFFRWEGGECRRLAPDGAVAPEALVSALPDGKVFFCGDGAAPFGALFRERLGDRAVFAPDGEGLPRAESVARFAERLIREGRVEDPRSVVPAYVRPSEAEIRRGAERGPVP